jgi:hypothetical protein
MLTHRLDELLVTERASDFRLARGTVIALYFHTAVT